MAIGQLPGSPFEISLDGATAPLIALFERDDAIAVPLLSQVRLAGYNVRAARTPVELFDLLGKHLVSLVLVDLGNATASRREFWVALDAQRRGRSLQVMTFRFTPPGGLFDTDFGHSPRTVADIEMRSPQEFPLLVDSIRQRLPLHGVVEASMPGLAPFGGAPSPFRSPALDYHPGVAISGTQQPGPYGPPPGQMPAFAPAPMQPGFGHSPFAMPKSASPFANPIGANPFVGEEGSAFAQALTVNPFAMEGSEPAPTWRQPAVGSFAPEANGPSGANRVNGHSQNPRDRLGNTQFEVRAARLSADYAAQFGLPESDPRSAQMPAFGASPSQLWGGERGNDAAPSGFDASFNGYHDAGSSSMNSGAAYQLPQHPPAGRSSASASPIADAWTPPEDDLDGQTGVVPEMAFAAIAGSGNRGAPGPVNWPTYDIQSDPPTGPEYEDTHYNATPLRETMPMPQPSRLPMVRSATPTETALGNVLVEGALLSPQKLEALRGIQQMLAGVNMHLKLGELALLFKFLSPDQLLAAMLVSRGYISPQQIAGLGRVKQELAASGMDYDLETLLSMFHILAPEQLRQIRAELR